MSEPLLGGAERYVARIRELEAEVERLRDAIYMHGESPMEQRLQIDPVQYMTTRYVPVHNFNHAISQLKAIVENPPKTKDGVPVVPGMHLWYRHPKTGRIYKWLGENMFAKTHHFDTNGQDVLIGVEDCYSTREAAEAAGGEPMNQLNWRKAETDRKFTEGEELFVAVRITNRFTKQHWWEFDVMIAVIDEGDEEEPVCYFEGLDGDLTSYEWDDVSYWIPLDELTGTLPEEGD